MKKWWFVVIVMVSVFGFSVGAYAGCHNCEKCQDGYVDCSLVSGQGVDDPQCGTFDYDSDRTTNFNPSEWCDVSVSNPLDTCRVIFDICQCEDVETNFDVGQTIGIRMTLLINGVFAEADDGFYFAEPNWGTNVLETFDSLTAACTATGQKTKSFGTVTYYDNADGSVGNVVTPRDGIGACPVAAANQAVMMCTSQGQGFQIPQSIVTNQESKWWIDMLGMRIDPNILNNNELLSVKIELLNAQSGGICATCESICECIVDIAIVCCPDGFYNYCISFPYVIQQDTEWTTGIGLTYTMFDGTPWMPTITFTDREGVAFTATPTYTKGTVSFSVDELVTSSGWAPAAGPGWLNICLMITSPRAIIFAVSNVSDEPVRQNNMIASPFRSSPPIDALAYYMFILDDMMFGAAVHARQPSGIWAD